MDAPVAVPDLPGRVDGKPALWWLGIGKTPNKGVSMASFQGEWGDQPKRIALDLAADYKPLFGGSLDGLIQAVRDKPDTQVFLHPGPFDDFRGYDPPRNLWFGAVLNPNMLIATAEIAKAELVLRAVAGRKWLRVRSVLGVMPAALCELIGAEWCVFDAPLSRVELEIMAYTGRWLNQQGRRFWIDASLEELAAVGGLELVKGLDVWQAPR